jgi:FkbM family methyltransferase
MKLNWSPRMTQYLVEQDTFRDNPFSLVDVGCSGGIQDHWRHFRGQFRALGFDPLIREVERLNASRTNPSVLYVAARVGCRAFARVPKTGLFNNDAYPRSTTERAIELLRMNYTNTYFDQTHEGAKTAELVELDEFLRQHPGDVDFLKTDTDGFDIEALSGARQLLSGAGPIGAQVETQFGGWPSPDANLFSNVDPYLRGLATRCLPWTRSCTPGPLYRSFSAGPSRRTLTKAKPAGPTPCSSATSVCRGTRIASGSA